MLLFRTPGCPGPPSSAGCLQTKPPPLFGFSVLDKARWEQPTPPSADTSSLQNKKPSISKQSSSSDNRAAHPPPLGPPLHPSTRCQQLQPTMYPSPVPAFHRDRFSIFSHSLGDHSAHRLPYKLTAAAFAGFPAVEVSLIDLEDHAAKKACGLVEAAHEIGELCRALGLRVTCIQPLRDVVESRRPAADGASKAISLFPVMDALNTELLLVCSSSLPADQLDPSTQTAVDHLRAIGVAAANWTPSPKKVAFEALSWGTHINLWRQAWDIVQAVDMENVGICLDSFNTLAREWADPTVPGGIQANAETDLRKSMSELSQLPGTKIFLLQIGDGARLATPLERGTAEKPALMTWSRSSRLFPMEFDRGGYLPVPAFIEAVVRTGYSGPWSLEIFNSSLRARADPTPITHALRGFLGLSKLVKSIFTPHHHHHHHHHNPIDEHVPAETLHSPSSLHLISTIRPYAQFKPAFHRPNLSFCASDASSLELNQPCSPPATSEPDHFAHTTAISSSPGKLCYNDEHVPDCQTVDSHPQISASTRPLHLC
ncbi:hypothetical protein PtB15_16B178 [Puccinia triticina]|nr:hypothetical protein PtB15_16B178 [Puccinia triticina]